MEVLKTYDFKEQADFESLMPKVIEQVGKVGIDFESMDLQKVFE